MSTEAEYHYWGAFDVIKSNGNNLPPAPRGWHITDQGPGRTVFYHDCTDTNFRNWSVREVRVGDYVELDCNGVFSFVIPEAVFDRYFTMREV